MTATAGQATDKKISQGYIYFFGSFGGILFGYDIGVMTGALPFLQSAWDLHGKAAIIGWITSSLMLGAVLGGALAGQLSDRLGRKKMILISSLVFMAFSLLCAFAPNKGWIYLVIMRIFLGLGVGAARPPRGEVDRRGVRQGQQGIGVAARALRGAGPAGPRGPRPVQRGLQEARRRR